MRIFRPFSTVSASLFLMVVLAGCSSGPTVITNADPAADFMRLQSFSFARPLSTDSGNVTSLLSTQLMAATTRELEMLGWRQDSNNPDVLVDFLLETEQQIRSRPASASVGMHRGGRYGMWGTSMSTQTIEQTTQGALSIDIIDPARNQIIWEGTATNRVTDSIRRNQEESVNNFVAEIFANFP